MYRTFGSAVLTAAAAISFAAPCDGKAVIKTNPVSGNEERLCAAWDGHDFEIEWSEKTTGWSKPIRLTDSLGDDVAPDLAFSPDGMTGATWREGGGNGQILYRASGGDASQSWQQEAVLISTSTGDASAPRLEFDASGRAWIAWHEIGLDGSVRVMGGSGDSSDPWPLTFSTSLVAMTEASLRLDQQMRTESGEVWINWVDSNAELAYSVWNDASSTWGPVLLEPYSGPADIDDGQERIRQEVLP